MRLVLFTFLVSSSYFVWADTSGDQLAEHLIYKIDHALENALPPGPELAVVRADMETWIRDQARLWGKASPVARVQSKNPWSSATERAFKAEALKLSEQIAVLLDATSTDGKTRPPTRDVLAKIAQLYAMLSAYPGNKAHQLTSGLISSVPLLGVVTVGGVVGSGIYQILRGHSILTGPLLSQALFTGVVDGVGVAAVSLAAVLFSERGRNYFRNKSALSERFEGAAAIEAVFWADLATRFGANPRLKDFVPTDLEAEALPFFLNRLAWLAAGPGACEDVLVQMADMPPPPGTIF